MNELLDKELDYIDNNFEPFCNNNNNLSFKNSINNNNNNKEMNNFDIVSQLMAGMPELSQSLTFHRKTKSNITSGVIV